MDNVELYYVLFLILDAILLAITLYTNQNTKWKPFDTRKDNLGIAALIITASIPFTMLVGVIHFLKEKAIILHEVGAYAETPLMLAPMLCVFIWIVYYKKGSELLQSKEMQKNFIVSFYKEHVWEKVRNMGGDGRRFTSLELYDFLGIVNGKFIDEIRSRCIVYSILPFTITPEQFRDAFQPFLVSEETLEKILEQLVKENKIRLYLPDDKYGKKLWAI